MTETTERVLLIAKHLADAGKAAMGLDDASQSASVDAALDEALVMADGDPKLVRAALEIVKQEGPR